MHCEQCGGWIFEDKARVGANLGATPPVQTREDPGLGRGGGGGVGRRDQIPEPPWTGRGSCLEVEHETLKMAIFCSTKTLLIVKCTVDLFSTEEKPERKTLATLAALDDAPPSQDL